MQNKYKLKIEKEAKKQLKVIRTLYGESSLEDAMVEIKELPFIGKPLQRELTGSFSYRIGVYRIIYKIDKRAKIVKILACGHRAHVYE